MELHKLQSRIRELERENEILRRRLEQKDWDGVTRETYTTGNTERLDLLTKQFGIDEYPLE